MQDDFFTALGLHLQDLMAGFAGGVTNSFIFKKSNPWAIVGSIVVGMFAANYLGSSVGKLLGTTASTSAFIVGLAGMAVCQGIAESAASWKFFRGQKND
jgi:ABC-type xylose transport system permease subunit